MAADASDSHWPAINKKHLSLNAMDIAAEHKVLPTAMENTSLKLGSVLNKIWHFALVT